MQFFTILLRYIPIFLRFWLWWWRELTSFQNFPRVFSWVESQWLPRPWKDVHWIFILIKLCSLRKHIHLFTCSFKCTILIQTVFDDITIWSNDVLYHFNTPPSFYQPPLSEKEGIIWLIHHVFRAQTTKGGAV